MISSDEIIGFKRVLTLWLKVDVLRMLLFAHFVHAKGRLIRINIVQHVGILISSQPFVFPVKSVSSDGIIGRSSERDTQSKVSCNVGKINQESLEESYKEVPSHDNTDSELPELARSSSPPSY